jgi:hypothetical protein
LGGMATLAAAGAGQMKTDAYTRSAEASVVLMEILGNNFLCVK